MEKVRQLLLCLLQRLASDETNLWHPETIGQGVFRSAYGLAVFLTGVDMEISIGKLCASFIGLVVFITLDIINGYPPDYVKWMIAATYSAAIVKQ